MKYLYTLIFLLLSTPVFSQTQIVFDPQVKNLIDEIITNVHEERSLCLEYTKIKDLLLITDYKYPITIYTSRHSVVSAPCPPGFIDYHTHPPMAMFGPSLREYYQENTGQFLKEKQQMVYLSKNDIMYGEAHNMEYMMVQSTPNHYAWWSAEQVYEHKDAMILLPIENQKSW